MITLTYRKQDLTSLMSLLVVRTFLDSLADQVIINQGLMPTVASALSVTVMITQMNSAIQKLDSARSAVPPLMSNSLVSVWFYCFFVVATEVDVHRSFFFILFVTRIAYTTPQVFTVRSAWRVFMETLQSEDQQTVKSVHAPWLHHQTGR